MQPTLPHINQTHLTSQSPTKNPNPQPQKLTQKQTTMAPILLLAASAALTQAYLIPPLPILSVRDPLSNTTITTPAPAGGNLNSTFTYPGINAPRAPGYTHIAGWKVYIAFLVLGIVAAVLVPLLGGLLWYLPRRGKGGKNPKNGDVEMSRLAKMKVRGMVNMVRPQNAHVKPERYA